MDASIVTFSYKNKIFTTYSITFNDSKLFKKFLDKKFHSGNKITKINKEINMSKMILSKCHNELN